MRSGLEYNDTQPLILELLTKRNWFDSKQLDEIEEVLRARPEPAPCPKRP